MGWRDDYEVHRYADRYPMIEGKELADLVEDIKANGLKSPITVAEDGILLDGRNRLHALELAGLKLQPWQVQIYSGDDPIGFIKSANAHRRHLSKQQLADLTATDLIKAAQEEVAKLVQAEPVSTEGGRGKKNPVRQAVVEAGKRLGYSESTAKRALAKAEGKPESSKTRRRRTDAEIELDRFLSGYMGSVQAIVTTTFDDSALDLLSEKQKADAAEDIERARASLKALLDRLRPRTAKRRYQC